MIGMVADFPRGRDSVLPLLLFASLLALPYRVLSVAPDDFDTDCIFFAKTYFDKSYQPEEKVLIDTQYYNSGALLGIFGEDKLWISLDIDGTNGTSIERWTDQSQGICNHNLLVCGYVSGNQNNWMITQYINISRTGVTELVFNATYSLVSSSMCMGGCSESLGIRIFETNEPNEDNRDNTSSYSGNLATLVNIIDQVLQKPPPKAIPISESTTGLYLAVVDPSPGSCVGITHLALYYYVCPEQVLNLVKYPEVIAPTLANVQDIMVEATCVDNAILTSSETMLECKLRGQWETDGVICSCMEGHYLLNNSCEACPPGTYKDTVEDADICNECPINSYSTLPGSAKCTCADSYYRTSDETDNEACTTAPSKPQGLTVTTTDTNATLSWTPPISNGGRDDVFYKIKFKTLQDDQFNYYSPCSTITGTSAIVTSLVSLTTYTFVVVAENGVSQEFSDLFTEDDRTSASVSATTKSLDVVADTPTGYVATSTLLLSVCVTGVLSSAVTILITGIVVCLVMKKRQGTRDPVKTTLAPLPPIYDTVTETTRKENIELTGNVAYAHVNI